MSVSLIVPVFNRADLTSRFMYAVLSVMRQDDELIIVDNASNDHTPMVIGNLSAQTDKQIKYIRNETNLGFGVANNIGAEAAKNNKLIFISNDVDVLGDFITPVDEFLEADWNVMVGPRVITFPTGWNDLWEEVAVIPYVEGWFMATHRQLFENVGGFDPEIFIDYEDIDLSYRMHLLGISLAQIQLPVFHPMPGSSFGQLSVSRLELTRKAIAHFKQKWGFTQKREV